MFLYSVHLHCFLYGWILFEAVLVWIGFLDAYIRKCFSKRNEIACFNNRPGRNFPRFRDSFLTKANRYPIQKACGGGGVSALLRKNVPTFAGKRRHFPWKTCRLPCKTSRTYPADRREDAFRAELQPFFVRNCNRFSCGIFLGNFRSEVPERNGLCLQMRFGASVSLVWRIKESVYSF